MELAVIGVIGQIIALRFLVIQAARRPDDPRLVGPDDRMPNYAELQERERARRQRIYWGVIALLFVT